MIQSLSIIQIVSEIEEKNLYSELLFSTRFSAITNIKVSSEKSELCKHRIEISSEFHRVQ